MGDGIRFEVLGPLRVIRDDQPVDAGGQIQQRVLAQLLADANMTVSVDRLVEEVWGGNPPPSARHLVEVYVSRLRGVVGIGDGGATFRRDGAGYRLEVGPDRIDAERFESLLSAARGGGTGDAELLEEAISLWQGRPFGDLGDDMPAVRMEADRLEELERTTREDWFEARLEAGRHQDLIADLRDAVERCPFRERRRAQLMLALYRSGREAEALRAFARFRDFLGEELGTEPSADLRQLEERILLQDPSLLPAPPAPPSNLPAPITSFVGRAAELEELARRLATDRLVTLTGIGGIGKTRLALAAARQASAGFPDGVWWVDLSPLDHPDLVEGRIAEVLGVTAQPGITLGESIVRSTSHRRVLLVLDNCEHLTAGVAPVVAQLLQGCPALIILATSRVPLDVAGEVRWATPPMGQLEISGEPSAQDLLEADAIRLFVERAGAADRSFRFGEANAVAIATACRRLDGLPLAIEMAAARVAAFAPAQIVDLLEDRFSLLRGPRHPGIPRHETLVAALDWSYQLLAGNQQEVFDHLAVFAAGFDLEAVCAVVGMDRQDPDVVDAVAALADSSLVSVRQAAGDSARYRIMETVREFAGSRLAEKGAEGMARTRHADHFLGLLESAVGSVATPRFTVWLRRFEESYDDIRQALAWSLEHQPRGATLLAAPALREFWYRQARASEAAHWGRLMIGGAADAPAVLRAAAYDAVAFGCDIAGDIAGAIEHSETAIDLYRAADDGRGLVQAHFTRAQVALAAGDFAMVESIGRESLERCEVLGERWLRSRPLTVLGFAALFGTGDLDAGAGFFEEALTLYRELDDRTSQVVMALTPLCALELRRGNLSAAEQYAFDALAVSDFWDGSALSLLGDVRAAQGDLPGSRSALRRALERALEVGLENWFRVNARKLALLAFAAGETENAARLWGASTVNLPDWGGGIGQEEAGILREKLGIDEFDRLVREGAGMSHKAVLVAAKSW